MPKLVLILLVSQTIWAAGGSCGSIPVPSGITNCYYFDKSSGSDSANGTSESTPQAHLPCMPSYTGSITPTAGEAFIMKGGSHWVNADMECYWQWSGTSTAPIYIGVDQTWHNGSSWTRPIWDCGGSACTYTANGDGFYKDQSAINYITLDNVEFTGLYQSTTNGPSYVDSYGNNNTFEHLYAHGWSHAPAGAGTQDNASAFTTSACCGGGLNNRFLYDIVDGSDTTQDMLVAFSGNPTEVGYSIINYVTNGIEGSQNNVHDTLIENIEFCFTTAGCHENAIQQAGPTGGATSTFFYNIVITGVVSGGITKLWLGQAAGGSPQTVYAFNNILYNNAAGNDVNPCQLNAGSCGTYYYFNNTFECGSSSGVGPCQSTSESLAPTQVSYWINNQCIAAACVSISNDPNFTYTETDDLVQTVATASSQGYTYNSTYAFQPTRASGGTVGQGTNKQSLCTTISGLNATAGAACQNDAGYACSYNTSNHTVTCPNRTEVTRPPSAAWDIGAYQLTPTGCSIIPTSIGPYTEGQSVSQQFTASNCSTSTFTISSGSLSGSGLTLSSGGLLSGTAQGGSFNFTVAYGTATDTISLTEPPTPPTSFTATAH